MKIVKCKLSAIVKSKAIGVWLKETAERAHAIKTSLYLLCKLCLLERFPYLQPETIVGQRKAHTARRGAT